MKVAIDVAELRIGMYVCDLDRPWRDTPFLFQGFEIRTQEEIDTLRKLCRQVTVLGPDAAPVAPAGRGRRGTPTQPSWASGRDRQLRIEGEIYKLNNHPNARSVYDDVTSVQQEIEEVRDTFIESRLLAQEIMHDAKLGRSLNVGGAKRAVRGLTESILRNPDALNCFAQLKRKDEYTALHSLRVCILALSFGRHLGLPRERLELLGLGALLHDIGKVKVPDEILNKPAELTADEYGIMKRHVEWGVEILARTGQIPPEALEVVGGHHERFNGSGYLHGLRGDMIGEFAMIGAIVDHYDAITSDRAYRGAVAAHNVLKKMYEWRDTLFSAGMVEKFIQCLGIYPIGSVVELNTGEIGVVAAINRVQRLKPHVMLVFHADHTPYPELPITNLADRRTADNRPCEIERVLEPSVAGIDPTQYLRIAVSL
ncbi:MAG TPA: HD-GYP domain-containing protein [Acidiferrobacterales bacterium]